MLRVHVLVEGEVVISPDDAYPQVKIMKDGVWVDVDSAEEQVEVSTAPSSPNQESNTAA